MDDQTNVDVASDDAQEEQETDTTDWKAEAKKLSNALGTANRQITKLKKEDKVVQQPANQEKDSQQSELSLDQEAYLIALGIKSEEAHNIIKQAMESTGKNFKEVAKDKFVLGQIKKTEELKASEEAAPDGTKRSTTQARDSVDYWSKKYEKTGELPPLDQPEMRKKVINTKMKTDKNTSKYTDTPIGNIGFTR